MEKISNYQNYLLQMKTMLLLHNHSLYSNGELLENYGHIKREDLWPNSQETNSSIYSENALILLYKDTQITQITSKLTKSKWVELHEEQKNCVW